MRRFIIAMAVTIMVTSACAGGTTTLTPRETEPSTQSDSESSMSSGTQEETDSPISPVEESPSDGGGLQIVDELGDRANPAPVGTLVQISDDSGQAQWEVTLVSTSLNVNDEIMAANYSNELPDAGLQYARAAFLVKYVGTDKGFPGSDLGAAFVSSSGTTHKQSDTYIAGPNPLSNLNELYTGGEAEGSVYIAIPIADAAEGTWRLSNSLASDEYFFQAQ